MFSYTGYTIDATSATTPDARLTLAGFTAADLNVKFTESFGTVGGSNYMLITGIN